jgi:hypothetical protein
MGQAEQRQVRSGVADRVREAPERAATRDGRLGEIRRHRLELGDAERAVRGHQAGLRAAVGLAILARDPPTDQDVAQAAGWTVEQVEQLRADLR